MKKIFVPLSAVLVLSALGSPTRADEMTRWGDPAESVSIQDNPTTLSQELSYVTNLVQIDAVDTLDLSTWHVGDSASYDISLGGFMKVGTLVKSMSKDEGNAIWIHQEIAMQGQNDVVDTELDKASGKVLKMVHNGQDEQIPDDKIQIVSEKAEQVTVPAGTFQSIHVVAKSDKVKNIEVWINPRDTVMDGTLKQTMSTDMGMDVTMELTQFHRA